MTDQKEQSQGTLTKQKRTAFVMSPHHLFCNSSITSEAKSLWVVLESKPEGWKFFWSEILKHFKEGRDQMIRAMGELEKLGYIQKKRAKKGNLYSGMDIQVFYDPLLPFDPHQQNQGSARDPEIQGTEIQGPENQASESQLPENQGTYKDLPEPKLSNQKISKPGKGIFSEISEGKGWEEQKILDALDEEALIKIVENAPGYDLDWLIEKYLPWVREKGWPKNIKIAFPAWAGKYTKSKKVFATPTRALSSSLSWKKPQSQAVSPDLVILRIKSVLSPENWEKYFAGKSLEETESGWKIIVSDPSAFEHEEVLKQIKVEIKCQK